LATSLSLKGNRTEGGCTRIGILGAGNVGGTLGQAWAHAGHEIFFGVRKPSSPEMAALLERCAGQSRAGSLSDAAGFADVVACTLPWAATESTLTSLVLSGKILPDATNPLLPDLSGLAVGTTQSAGELVATWARGARVVKIFNTIGANIMANPSFSGRPLTMSYCGDDLEAKQVAALLPRTLVSNHSMPGRSAMRACLNPLPCFGSGWPFREGSDAISVFSL
jgi:8-hydroxy-5-deazaflavin:NADPH oxidoreductase